MKKRLSIVLAIFIFIGIFTACKENVGVRPEFSFDASGSYSGFETLPREYTIEAAEKDGCVVRQSGSLGIVANEKQWDKFVKTASMGKDSVVRLVFFTDDSDYPYITDIFYKDGAYYLFDSTADSFKKQPYKYLLILEGQFGNPLRDSGVVILSDDNSLTFDTVMKTMLSSDMNYINSISDYRLVMFQ